MATETFGVPLAYVIVVFLTLWVLVSVRGKWWLKALVTAAALLFGVGLWSSLQSLQGWPVEADLPERFEIKWLFVREPAKQTGSPGAVYVWAVDIGEVPSSTPPFILRLASRGGGREPRLYRLPYSRSVHEQAEEIQDMISGGGRFFATMGKIARGEAGTAGGKRGTVKGAPGAELLEDVTGDAQGPISGTGRLSPQDYVFYELPPPRLPEKNPPPDQVSPPRRP